MGRADPQPVTVYGLRMGPDPYSCPDCLHPREQHVVDGCCARDDLGNRCPCIQPANW